LFDDRYPLRFATGRCAKPARSVAVDRRNGRGRWARIKWKDLASFMAGQASEISAQGVA
jgi:hypothetical protein